MTPLADLQSRISALDVRIEPLIWRLDLSGPDWREKIKARGEKTRAAAGEPYVPVLDRAGLRPEAEALLREILDLYVGADSETRAEIRALFREFHSFAWAIGGAKIIALGDGDPGHPISTERCRDCLTLFAIQDQGNDPRDAILWLQKLCRVAGNGGLPLTALLTEAAERSSDEVRFAKVGGSSTRAMLLNYAERFAKGVE
jgi:hypothetical protein